MFRNLPESARVGSRFGHALKLRDRGRYAEALTETLSLFDAVSASADGFVQLMMVTAAALIDDLASQCGQPEVACAPLEKALAFIRAEQSDKKNNPKAQRYLEHLASYEHHFSARLQRPSPRTTRGD